MRNKYANFSDLKGLTIDRIEQRGDDELYFYVGDRAFRLMHHQDCCESVTIEDIAGDIAEIKDALVTLADEPESKTGDGGEGCETWTFYRLRTTKGDITIRFYGTSSGYYSETAEFEEVTK